MKAITRAVPASLAACELTFVDRAAIDLQRARAQHDAYVNALRRHGVEVSELSADDTLPDSVFVEDPVLVLDEVAIALPMGAASRQHESAALLKEIARYRDIVSMAGPGSVEGGDVLRVGRELYVGLSRRTDLAGVASLRQTVARYGYVVRPVRINGCLHLKTGCTRVGDRFLVNPSWIDTADLAPASLLRVAPGEPFGANTLSIGSAVLTMASCPGTAELLEGEGFRVEGVDIGELQKAEAGLTCLSIVFEAS